MTTTRFVALSIATLTSPAATSGSLPRMSYLASIGLFIAQRDDDGRWHFDLASHAIGAGDGENALLAWASDAMPADGIVLGWQLADTVLPPLLDAAEQGDAEIGRAFLERLAKLATGPSVDLAVPHGGAGAPPLATVAAAHGIWSATANALYIVRQDGEDLFGPTPRFADKLTACPDLVDHGRRGPTGCDADHLVGLQLWRAADEAALTDRPSAPVAFHAVGWLPTNMPRHGWRELILQFLDEQIVAAGMVADWALHALADDDGRWIKKPHVHAVITSRFWKGPRLGQPQPAWFQTAKHRAAVADAWAAKVTPSQ